MADEPKTIEDAFDGVQSGQSNIVSNEVVPPAEPSAEKTWSERGLPEEFNNMDPDAMAQRVKEALFREKQWGTQGEEIGNLRRRNKELEGSMRGALGDKPADVIEDMSAGQQADFWKAFELNPQKAIKEIAPMRSEDDLKGIIGGVVYEILQQYDNYNSKSRYKESHEDWSQHEPYVKLLRSEENFGNGRSYDECQKIARLVAENKSLADVVYSEMKAHPTMSFERAKKIAELELGAQAATQRVEGDLEKQVKKVPSTGGKSQKSTDEKIISLDDAWDNA